MSESTGVSRIVWEQHKNVINGRLAIFLGMTLCTSYILNREVTGLEQAAATALLKSHGGCVGLDIRPNYDGVKPELLETAYLQHDIDAQITAVNFNFGTGDPQTGVLNGPDSAEASSFFEVGGMYDQSITITMEVGTKTVSVTNPACQKTVNIPSF